MSGKSGKYMLIGDNGQTRPIVPAQEIVDLIKQSGDSMALECPMLAVKRYYELGLGIKVNGVTWFIDERIIPKKGA